MTQRKETFIAHALRKFKENISNNFTRANKWRKYSVELVADKIGAVGHYWGWDLQYEKDDGPFFRFTLIIPFLFYSICFNYLISHVLFWASGWTAVNFSVGISFMVLILLGTSDTGWELYILPSHLAAWLFSLLTLVIKALTGILVSIFTFLVMLLWIFSYGLIQTVIASTKLLLLIPLFLLFLVTRVLELWRGIFYTCPSRQCAYRGLPVYVCPKCGTGNRDLWPNLYGLLHHYCTKCDTHLPTLDLLGRDKLNRLCGGPNCGIPLLGKHAGRAPERLVAIAGGPGSGKTNYLLMAVQQIIQGNHNGVVHLYGEIDDPSHAEEFTRVWQQHLALGSPAAKTAAVEEAFLLYAHVGRKKCQLYLYDAPGEEFTSLTAMSARHYLPLLEGFIFLVDPFSFDAFHSDSGHGYTAESFKTVVNTTLGTTLKGVRVNQDGKIPMRAAVVISKADLSGVQEQIGDIRAQAISGLTCRAALEKWGAGGELRLLEHRFETVEYFACSPLGREFDPTNRQTFQGAGVLEPLAWVLNGER